MSTPLIETKELKTYFKTGKGLLHAVDNVNIAIDEGKTLGVVGESGCGKSTLGRSILRLIEPTSGEVLYKGENILKYSKKQMAGLRKEMQLIFQDPYASLNPRLSISEIIMEPLKVGKVCKDRRSMERRVYELMETAGIASRLVNAYPHELDGGRRQRVGIARALASDPDFIVCDEPVSALDVSIQAQVLNLLMELQETKQLTYMFVTHDLSVVKHISDEIAVMYLGECVEKASVNELFKNPLHPYTQALLKAIPTIDIDKAKSHRDIIRGEVSSPIDPNPGCRFAARCPYAKKECVESQLRLKNISNYHQVACIQY